MIYTIALMKFIQTGERSPVLKPKNLIRVGALSALAVTEACGGTPVTTVRSTLEPAAVHMAEDAIHGLGTDFINVSSSGATIDGNELDYIGQDHYHRGQTAVIRVIFNSQNGPLKSSEVAEIDVIEGNCAPVNGQMDCSAGFGDYLYAPSEDYQNSHSWNGTSDGYKHTFGHYQITESLSINPQPSSRTSAVQSASEIANRTLSDFNKVVGLAAS